MAYTKGEWRLSGDCKVVLAEKVKVAVVMMGITEAEGRANAHLIAAAPAMYEALKSLSLGDIDPEYRKIIVALLAKAKGKGG